ncbi:MAG: hypothetical protein KKA67_09800 [Spirochaetes bacterium]|nr:hypothetical protein [Spirochaetota bacterium]MBU1081063.1 hypothetical protein [Spirochaetota bacterium]
MIGRPRSLAIALACAALVSARPAACDEYYSDHGFSIDLPEGFAYLEGDGSTKFSFGSPDGAVRVDMIVYPPARFSDARSGAADTMRRLSGRGDFQSFRYEGKDAAVGEISFGDGAYRGRALFVDGASAPRSTADAAAPERTYDLAVLAYAPAAAYGAYADVVGSAMDGFSLRVSRRAAPGPLGSASRAGLGQAAPRTAAIAFGEATVRVPWDPREAAISQALVEREYRVLTAYAEAPELLDAAIARFYRMAFRDAAPSLDRLALELSAAWETGAWAGERASSIRAGRPAATGAKVEKKAAGPRFGAAASPGPYAEALLAWVQGFNYERDPAGSDVVNPISAAFEGRGDCDSRALVMATLLQKEGVEAILMISLKYEHALAAVDAPGPGARFPFDGKQWLVAETTAKVGIGRIDASQADPSAWIGVRLPR